jgi:hypothetical protein
LIGAQPGKLIIARPAPGHSTSPSKFAPPRVDLDAAQYAPDTKAPACVANASRQRFLGRALSSGVNHKLTSSFCDQNYLLE